MRVLQVHNRYRSGVPSGENAVVEAEAESLSAAGMDVIRYVRSSDEIDEMSLLQRATLPVRPFYSVPDVRAVSRLIRQSRPDVLHLHNPNPLVSMSVVGAALRHGVPVVMTAHNHRHSCVKGSLRREGKPCRDCEGRALPWPAVVHGCYRGSRMESLAMAGALVSHRGSYAQVSRFIAISTAMKTSLLRSGVSDDRIVIKPNGVADPGPDCPPVRASDPPRWLFLGRLDEDKGVRLLIDVWARRRDHSPGHLTFVGSGELEEALRAFASKRRDVTVTGQVAPAAVGRLIEESTAVLVPSLWEEPFGLVVLEAYARKRPVLCTGAGGLADLLHDDCSWQVAPDVTAWAEALGSISVAEAARKGLRARAVYLANYTPMVVTERLIRIYESVLS